MTSKNELLRRNVMTVYYWPGDLEYTSTNDISTSGCLIITVERRPAIHHPLSNMWWLINRGAEMAIPFSANFFPRSSRMKAPRGPIIIFTAGTSATNVSRTDVKVRHLDTDAFAQKTDFLFGGDKLRSRFTCLTELSPCSQYHLQRNLVCEELL